MFYWILINIVASFCNDDPCLSFLNLQSYIHHHRLIASIRKIVLAARTIERHINGSSQHETTTPAGIIPKEALEAFRKSLDTKCPIPLDLLDLLDVGAIFGMNPQIYARGLIKESMRQLSGLERRKRGLVMLADAIEAGMAKCDGDDIVTGSQKPEISKSEPSADTNAKEENETSVVKTKCDDGTVTDSQKPGVLKSEPTAATNVKEEDGKGIVTGDTNKRKRDKTHDEEPVVKKERVHPSP